MSKAKIVSREELNRLYNQSCDQLEMCSRVIKDKAIEVDAHKATIKRLEDDLRWHKSLVQNLTDIASKRARFP